jgi:hypothetical protein
MCAFHLHAALLVVTANFPVLVGRIWTTRNLQDKSGKSHQTEPCDKASSVDSPICGRCHMATEMASHILCEYVAVAEFRFHHLEEHFYGTKRLQRDSVM